MKKIIITLLAALLLLPATVSAQYRLVIKYNDNSQKDTLVWDIASISFEAIAPEQLPEGGASPEAVDLGLSVKWANMNLGATSPEETGWLVGWGDVTAKNVSTVLKWYPVENPTGDIAGFSNDIIKSYWGESGSWRLPTDEELQELIDNCQWTWDEATSCFTVTGNGHSITLPAAGYREGSTTMTTANYYWSGTLSKTDNTAAKALSVIASGESATPTLADVKRCMGCALRAVNGEAKVNVSITAGDAYDITYSTSTATAQAKVKVQLDGSYANYTSLRYGILYGTSNDLNNDPTRQDVYESSISADGSYVFTLTNMQPDVVYYYIPYVVVNGKTCYSVEGPQTFQTTSFPVPEKVDLGLSVKWASFNVGASAPEEAGRYVGWGDNTGMLESFNGNDYAVGNNSLDIRGNVKYDVAANKWGDKWRMATRAEFIELFQGTTVSVVVSNGVTCYKFLAKNGSGNYILLPVVGLVNDSYKVSKTNFGWYWTSECTEDARGYMTMIFSTSTPDLEDFEDYVKWFRTPIRAVYEESSSQSGGGESGGGESGGGSGDDPVTPVTPESPTAGTAVDLGLPSGTLWADRNIGSTSTDLVGDYLTWGAINEQTDYTVKGYIYYNASGYNGMTYLGTSSDYTASYSICGTEYDAARQRWGSTWSLPTRAQITELREQCTWTWTSRSTSSGYYYGFIVQSKTNSNSIFLPAAGYMTQTGSLPTPYSTDRGIYWSGDAYYGVAEEHYNTKARTMEFTEDGPISGNIYKDRYLGLPIRPVKAK